MAVNIGPRIGIEGEAEYRKSIENIIQQQKTLKSEMEATSQAWDKNTSAEKKAQQQKEILSKQIDVQKQRVAELEKMLKASADKYGENDTKTLKWKEALNNANAELAKMQTELANIPGKAELLGQKFEEAGKKIEGVGDKFTGLGEKLAPVSTAAAGLVGGLTALGVKSALAADDLNTLSKQTGISTEELQKMKYASDLVDVSVENITGAIRKMKGNMAKDTGAAAEAFAQLGVSTRDASGEMRPAIDVFYDVIGALSRIPNETERDQAAMDIFGKSADQLAGVIDDGGASLKAYGEEAQNLGLILSQDTLDSLNSVNDTLDQTKANLDASFGQLGAVVAESLTPTIQQASDLVKQFAETLRTVDPDIMKVIMTIGTVVAVVSPILIVIGKVITAVGKIAAVVGKLIPLIKGAAAVIAGINPVVLAVAAGIAALITIGVELYKNWDTIKEKAKEFADNVSAKWKLTCEILKGNIEKLKTDAINAWESIKSKTITAVENIKTSVTNAWENIKSKVSIVMENIKTNVLNTWENLKTGVGNKIDNIKTAVTQKFESIKDKIKGIMDGAVDIVKGAVDRLKGLFDFNWELPRIKLPHFSVSGEFSLVPPSAPHIDVDWYSKAMRDGVILNKPTIFGAQNGRLMGGGEAGPEVVVGASSLFDMIRGAVATTNNYGGNNVYVYGAPGQDVKELAREIADIINADISAEGAAFA